MELRDVRTKKKQNVRQRPYNMVEVIRLESRPYKLLYAEGEDAVQFPFPTQRSTAYLWSLPSSLAKHPEWRFFYIKVILRSQFADSK